MDKRHLKKAQHFQRKEGLNELRSMTRDYLARKVQEEAERLYDEGVLSHDKLDEILKQHLRIPYE